MILNIITPIYVYVNINIITIKSYIIYHIVLYIYKYNNIFYIIII